MPKGEGLAITQITNFTSDEYWDTDGTIQPQNTYHKWELQPYVEYGLTERITIGGTAYLQHTMQSGDKNRGIADPEFFARMKLWQHGPHLLSIQPLIKLPSRFEHHSSTPRGGSKSTDAELSLLYGRNLPIVSDNDYADIRLGYRSRSRHLHSQFRFDAALGLKPFERWQFIPAMRYVEASTIDTAAFRQNGELDYDLLKGELTVLYSLPSGNWVHATYFKHLQGYQTGTGSGISLGYAVRF